MEFTCHTFSFPITVAIDGIFDVFNLNVKVESICLKSV